MNNTGKPYDPFELAVSTGTRYDIGDPWACQLPTALAASHAYLEPSAIRFFETADPGVSSHLSSCFFVTRPNR